MSRMRKPAFFIAFLLCSVFAFAALPFIDLNAAELWNKSAVKSDRAAAKEEKKRVPLYNAPMKRKSEGKVTLYNKMRSANNIGAARSGLQLRLEGITSESSINIKASKQMARMAPNAVKNRSSDIVHALEITKKYKKQNAKYMKKMVRESEKRFQKQREVYAQRIAQKEALKQKVKHEKRLKKQRAIQYAYALGNGKQGGTTGTQTVHEISGSGINKAQIKENTTIQHELGIGRRTLYNAN